MGYHAFTTEEYTQKYQEACTGIYSSDVGTGGLDQDKAGFHPQRSCCNYSHHR